MNRINDVKVIKKAKIKDVKEIYKILRIYGEKGELLSRPLSVLYENLRNFLIYKDEKVDKIVGCCALQFCWENLAEIRSLAVLPEYTGQKIGKYLTEAAIVEAKDFEIDKIFTLTYQPDFFKKFGFKIIDKGELPLKIWADCIHCLKFPDCDEIAMMLDGF